MSMAYKFLLLHSPGIHFVLKEYRSDKSVEAIKKLVPPGCHW